MDLYDDMITSSGPGGRTMDSESQDESSLPSSPIPCNSSNSASVNNSGNSGSGHTDSVRDSHHSVLPLRKHQAYVGNLTWVSISSSVNCELSHDKFKISFSFIDN